MSIAAICKIPDQVKEKLIAKAIECHEFHTPEETLEAIKKKHYDFCLISQENINLRDFTIKIQKHLHTVFCLFSKLPKIEEISGFFYINYEIQEDIILALTLFLNDTINILNANPEFSASLLVDFQNSVLEKIREIIDSAPKISKGKTDQLEEILTKLSQEAKTFGYHGFSKNCQEMRSNLENFPNLDEQETKQFTELFSEKIHELVCSLKSLSIDKSIFLKENVKKAPMPELGKIDVYVIDDDETIVSLIKAQAESENMIVEAEYSFEKAKETITQDGFHPKLILFDILSENEQITGYDLIKAYKDKYSGHPPSFIGVLTARGEILDRKNSAELGIDIFFQKPIDPPKLFYVIKKLIESKKTDKKTILFIDDDVEACSLFASCMPEEEYNVITSQNPHELMSLIDEHQPDLIFLDILMPEINGLELLSSIRSDTRFRKFPFVMLTAKQDPQVIKQAFTAGATDYLFKPIDPKKIVQEIKQIERKIASQNLFFEKDLEQGLYNQNALKEFFITFSLKYPSLLVVCLFLDLPKQIPFETKKELKYQFGQRLNAMLGTKDIVGYWDDKTFLLMITGYKSADLKNIIRDISTRIFDDIFKNQLGEDELPSLDIFISIYPEDGKELDQIIYDAKKKTKEKEKKQSKIDIVVSENATKDFYRLKNKKVILITTDNLLKELIKYSLNIHNVVTENFNSYKNSLDWLENNYLTDLPDLIIIDSKIDADPLLLLHQIKKMVGNRTTIFVLSPQSKEEDVSMAISKGANSYFTKPFNLQTLIKKITGVLNV